jgi:alkanesulfonate monooxygenase SsuD/methylene tetrahydromethanopterin reductase-like flavin-dependent oxidoreductase (luciferase family)
MMHIMCFTERPYYHVPEEQIIKNASHFGVPNTYFDPIKGSELYNTYLDEAVYAEEMGFDGIMLNEHHGTPFTLGAVMDVEAAILARITKRVKIVLLGNPLPVADPLRLAEELAEIDMISGGRLVPGWVRGSGSESLFNNANPAFNRELFNEAHDFVIKTWTTPGPFRYEGKHYHYRFVNPWVLPLQKPHPPIWIPGVVSPETVVWCAQHRYPYVALATFLEPTIEMLNLYADVAAQEGYQAGPENFGYLQRVIVAETEEKAQELGKGFMYGGGIFTFARPEWAYPAGYNSKAATRRLARVFTDPKTGQQLRRVTPSDSAEDIEETRRHIYASYQAELDNQQIIVGTPQTVIAKLRKFIEVLRPGIFALWYAHGPSSHEDRMTSLRLLGQEVLPAMREMAHELDLVDPYERKPGSRPLPPSGVREPVVGQTAVAS